MSTPHIYIGGRLPSGVLRVRLSSALRRKDRRAIWESVRLARREGVPREEFADLVRLARNG